MLRKYVVFLFLLLICSGSFLYSRELSSKQYRFTISIPDSMFHVTDTANMIENDVYYDTSADIILMISEVQSKMKSVKDYIDCAHEELELMLKNSYGDTTLHLISCNKSPYYPDKMNVIIFDVGTMPMGFNRSIVYFVHHKKRDVQFSFTYNKEKAQQSMQYIDNIMKTLVLR